MVGSISGRERIVKGERNEETKDQRRAMRDGERADDQSRLLRKRPD
jgi:hypothetical protein